MLAISFLFPSFCAILLAISIISVPPPCVASSSSASHHALRRLSILDRFMHRQDEHARHRTKSCPERETDQYFYQKLDHFNESDTARYWQRYQVNLRYYNSTLQWPIVFLMIGGEGEIRDKWVCDEQVTMMQMAMEHGAIVVQLEHRFFGRNATAGLGELTRENMGRHLTLDQALADIAAFVPFFNEQYGLKSPRWVAFGGSYPGSMAAWLRVKYPQLTAGSVASSAPIWPKVDFWEYSDVMENAIRDTSTECYANVKSAFHGLARMVMLGGDEKQRLNELYHCKPKLEHLNSLDLTNFFSSVFGAWQGIIQYTYDLRNNEISNVSHACELLNGATELQKGLADVFYLAKMDECKKSGVSEKECLDNDFTYATAIAPMKEVSIEAEYADARAWIWMTCNEFGWYQTTDKDNSIFGDIISLGFYYQMCADLYGSEIGARYVEHKVRQTYRKWGDGCSYEATNVILPNGRYDPWSALGIRGGGGDGSSDDGEDCRDAQKRNDDFYKRKMVAVWTEGAAHCADMYPAYEGEPAGLELTREKVKSEVKQYLANALEEMTQNGVGRGQWMNVWGLLLLMALAFVFTMVPQL